MNDIVINGEQLDINANFDKIIIEGFETNHRSLKPNVTVTKGKDGEDDTSGLSVKILKIPDVSTSLITYTIITSAEVTS